MIFIQVDNAINPQDFFTFGTFTTLTGATGIVYITCGVIQKVFNFSPKWLALVISIIVSFCAMLLTPESPERQGGISEGMKYLVALLNGFLIYSSATGSNQLISSNTDKPTPPAPQSLQNVRRKFTTNWFQ